MSPDIQSQQHVHESMGSRWSVTVWDTLSAGTFERIAQEAERICRVFDETYSRFRSDSLVRTLAAQTGTVEVPADLVAMLRICGQFNRLSDGAFNPLVGAALEDMGYDENYSLTPKEILRSVPDLSSAIHIVDDTHIDLRQPVLIDIGAVGKGYAVDLITRFLDAEGLKRFLVDGSGDVFYRGDEPLRAGLEHPDDPAKAIGVIELRNCAFCASSGNRRTWNKYHHIIDPHTLTSPRDIIATWVKADSAAVADAAATAVFLCEPDTLTAGIPFEYCLLNSEYRVRQSHGFAVEFF
jgi:FAD:protein FMN transferase